ncbi:MAG: hypothetical protein Q4C45_08335 [Oscillospiraceae bacterium]|nr:hypothetical protein [Oscillospiraceae bacterium]
MENLFEWLYDHYAEPQLRVLPAFQEELLRPVIRLAPEEDRIILADQLTTLQMHWCTAAFQIGVQLGVRLS